MDFENVPEQSIRELVEYLWEDEKESFDLYCKDEEGNTYAEPLHHIFVHVKKVADWLNPPKAKCPDTDGCDRVKTCNHAKEHEPESDCNNTSLHCPRECVRIEEEGDEKDESDTGNQG